MTWAAKKKTDPLPEGAAPEKLSPEAALTAFVEGRGAHALKAVVTHRVADSTAQRVRLNRNEFRFVISLPNNAA